MAKDDADDLVARLIEARKELAKMDLEGFDQYTDEQLRRMAQVTGDLAVALEVLSEEMTALSESVDKGAVVLADEGEQDDTISDGEDNP